MAMSYDGGRLCMAHIQAGSLVAMFGGYGITRVVCEQVAAASFGSGSDEVEKSLLRMEGRRLSLWG